MREEGGLLSVELGRLDEVVRPQRDVDVFVRISVQEAEREREGAVGVSVEPVEETSDQIALWPERRQGIVRKLSAEVDR